MRVLTSSSRRRARPALVATVALIAALVGTGLSASPVSASAGDITTVAGGGAPESGVGDGQVATAALLTAPWGVDEAGGQLFITEEGRPRKTSSGLRPAGCARSTSPGSSPPWPAGAHHPLGTEARPR